MAETEEVKEEKVRMGFLKKLKNVAEVAGRVGQRMPTTADLIYGTKPKKRKV